MLNELPTDQNSHRGRSSRISLERQVRDLCTERELNHRNTAMLEDLNRTLGNTIRKLTAALDQRTNSTSMVHVLEKDFSIVAWNLQRSERDRAYLSDLTIGQQRIIEGQSHHIAVLTRELDNLQCATRQSDQGRCSRDA